MKETDLFKVLQRLNHGSQEAVQSGAALSDLDIYLHVQRPVEGIIMNKMDEINAAGGGLLLLVGSAGDGKSHLISQLKASGRFDDFVYLNDGTESCSPQKGINAVSTLKTQLHEFFDASIGDTTGKVLLAINLGKLLDLTEDPEVKEGFSKLCNISEKIADGDLKYESEETNKIKIVSFANMQPYELLVDNESDYPVDSMFMKGILQRLTLKSKSNPFYKAYCNSIPKEGEDFDPIVFNYQFLLLNTVQDAIVKLVIESVVRYNQTVTPREFLDFIYSILVYSNIQNYKERTDFFDALLPSLLFGKTSNKIQKSVAQLDPVKVSSVIHDDKLSNLYSAFDYDDSFLDQERLGSELANSFGKALSRFYKNKNKDKVKLTTLIFRMNHLLDYHSESIVYITFLHQLKGFYSQDPDTFQEISDLVRYAIPRHYGSYYDKDGFIPLNIQGSKYKLFAKLDLDNPDFNPEFDPQKPYVFDPAITMVWNFKKPVLLRISYSLFEHLIALKQGKLSTTYEGEQNLDFSNFIRTISKFSDAEKEVKIIDSDNNVHTFAFKWNKLQLN